MIILNCLNVIRVNSNVLCIQNIIVVVIFVIVEDERGINIFSNYEGDKINKVELKKIYCENIAT